MNPLVQRLAALLTLAAVAGGSYYAAPGTDTVYDFAGCEVYDVVEHQDGARNFAGYCPPEVQPSPTLTPTSIVISSPTVLPSGTPTPTQTAVPSTFTPSPPPTTPPSSTPGITTTPTPISGTTIQPGQSIQAAVNAAPNGTTFVLAAGVYQNQQVNPKTGQSFVCAIVASPPRCIMDGNFGTIAVFAFVGTASNVTIRGLEIREYRTASQLAAIDACSGSGWLIENNLVTWNHSGGIRIGPNGRAINNVITYNGQLGVKACGSNGLYQGNEIAYNNSFCPAGFPVQQSGGGQGCNQYGFEGGGSKFAVTSGLRVIGNHVHGNCGPGLWTDIQNDEVLYEGNLVENNSSGGIFHEISYDARIVGNTARGNTLTQTIPHPAGGASRTCSGGGGAYGHAEIVIANSRGIDRDLEITGNTVGAKGILVVEQLRNGGVYPTRRIYPHDNAGVSCTKVGVDTEGSFNQAQWDAFLAGNPKLGARC